MELVCTNLWSLLAGQHNSVELACRHKSTELACLLAPSLGSVFAHFEIQFILKLCNFCCYFFCDHFRVQWALLAVDLIFVVQLLQCAIDREGVSCSIWRHAWSITRKDWSMQNYSSLHFLLKKSLHQHSSFKYCKILLHYFCSWKSQQHSSISWIFFFDVTNIQPEPEKSSRTLLMHLVDLHFQSSRNLCMQSGWLSLSLSYIFEEPWESLYHICTTNFSQLKNPSLSLSCIQILKVFGVLSVPV